MILSQCAVYLASSPKSNSTYKAINEAMAKVRETGNLSIPLGIRNAPTKLMKQLGYGDNYQYAHNYEGNFVAYEFMPEELVNTKFYTPGKNANEAGILTRLANWWKGKYY
ncbi:MAG: hypothetical protein R2879_14985 [Saprospiraceae bacterium]